VLRATYPRKRGRARKGGELLRILILCLGRHLYRSNLEFKLGHQIGPRHWLLPTVRSGSNWIERSYRIQTLGFLKSWRLLEKASRTQRAYRRLIFQLETLWKTNALSSLSISSPAKALEVPTQHLFPVEPNSAPCKTKGCFNYMAKLLIMATLLVKTWLIFCCTYDQIPLWARSCLWMLQSSCTIWKQT
jgi:hypothetical protein